MFLLCLQQKASQWREGLILLQMRPKSVFVGDAEIAFHAAQRDERGLGQGAGFPADYRTVPLHLVAYPALVHVYGKLVPDVPSCAGTLRAKICEFRDAVHQLTQVTAFARGTISCLFLSMLYAHSRHITQKQKRPSRWHKPRHRLYSASTCALT